MTAKQGSTALRFAPPEGVSEVADNAREFAHLVAKTAMKLEGWRVSRSRAGTKITNPAGEAIVLHETPGDRNHVPHNEALLKKMGYDKAVAALKRKEDRERKAKIAEDAASNARALKVAAAKAKLVVKAAGPYAGEELDLNWAFARHTHWEHRLCFVTPAAADKILADHNNLNRSKKKRTQAEFGQALKDGRALLTHEAIAFDENGELLDAQNRVQAVKDTGIGAWFFVYVGMNPATREVVGRSIPRTAGDSFTIKKIPNAVRVAQITKFVMMLGEPYGTWEQLRFGDDQALVRYEQDPEAFQQASAEAAALIGFGRKTRRFRMSLTVVGAHLYLLRHERKERKDGTVEYVPYPLAHQDRVTEFLEGLQTGAGLRSGDSRIALRDWVEDRRERKISMHRFECFAVLRIAWSTYLAGTKVPNLKWVRGSERFPVIAKQG